MKQSPEKLRIAIFGCSSRSLQLTQTNQHFMVHVTDVGFVANHSSCGRNPERQLLGVKLF